MEINKYIGGIVETNAYLLIDKDFVILIDAPEGVCSWLQDFKTNNKIDKIDKILITHQHFDHVQDLCQVMQEWECPSLSWQETDMNLTESKLFMHLLPGFGVKDYKITHPLRTEKSIHLNDTEVEILHTPGHSPDSISFYLKKQQLLFSGDVIFKNSIGRSDFPNASPEVLLNSIATKILPLSDEVQIYPGHGPKTSIATEKKSNPFLQQLNNK